MPEKGTSEGTKWAITIIGILIAAGIIGSIGAQISFGEWKGKVNESLKHLAEDNKRERDLVSQQLAEIKSSLRRLEAKSK